VAIKVETKPTEEPVTLDEAKLHCRLDHDDEDSLMETLIATARQYGETFTGRSFCTQTIKYYLDKWPSGNVIYLPRPPVQSVTSVKWTDNEGTETTLTEGDDYEVDTDSEPARLILPYGEKWPTGTLATKNPIEIEYIAGYGDASDVPEYVQAAIKLYIAGLYENREAVLPAGHVGKRLPMGVEALLWQERAFWSEELNK